MFRRPVKPRGRWESSAVLSESESSAFVTGGGWGFGIGGLLAGDGEQQLEPELCTRGL